LELGKYSIGIGDRFASQGKAQLNAIIKAKELGVEITPVWNKSFREHQIVNSKPLSTRKEADDAVRQLNWQHNYFVDADHVGLQNIDFFIDCSDFFTLDVADYIGKKAEPKDILSFVEKYEKYAGKMQVPGIEEEFQLSKKDIEQIAERYLYAVQEAGKTYRHILTKKDKDAFVVEVSMDETEDPQTPVELLFILAAIADQNIPVQTIAPKFTGRFNKGVDYVGNLEQFTKEFEQDVAVINFAIKEFNLPEQLKLSVHSGSDKFSIYKPIKAALKKFEAGVHLKTAGTTWLEELIGLAEAGGDGLELAKEIYITAFSRFDELAKPYATVIDIDQAKLPHPSEVEWWDGHTYASTLRHDLSHKLYNSNFRQLLHVAYKVAAEMGERYLSALTESEKIVAKNVTENIFERHIKLLFL
jgi:tagaturonate epimerase